MIEQKEHQRYTREYVRSLVERDCLGLSEEEKEMVTDDLLDYFEYRQQRLMKSRSMKDG